jgi:Beta-ketoacyl synthase, N-terminal domain
MSATQLGPFTVEGIAFWSTRMPGWEIARAVMRGDSIDMPPPVGRPQPTLLAPTERRRVPDTVALALEVANRACEAAGRDPRELAAVFASTYGDLAISDYLCSTLVATPTLVSPVKFHNSVHNAAAGYWSIGTHSFATYTALTAYRDTFGAGLLECATQALCADAPNLYVAFDIEAKGALATMAPSRGLLAAALILRPGTDNRRPTLQLTLEHDSALTAAISPAAQLVSDNALSPCVPLFEALALGQPTDVVLSLGDDERLRVSLVA